MSIEEIINGLDFAKELVNREMDDLISHPPAISGWAPELEALAFNQKRDAACNSAYAIHAAIDLLKTHPEAQPNEPLTLDELREMVGNPVWVETPGVDRKLSGRWVIVAGASPEDAVLFCNGDFNCWDYGRVWLAYRRQPKED